MSYLGLYPVILTQGGSPPPLPDCILIRRTTNETKSPISCLESFQGNLELIDPNRCLMFLIQISARGTWSPAPSVSTQVPGNLPLADTKALPGSMKMFVKTNQRSNNASNCSCNALPTLLTS